MPLKILDLGPDACQNAIGPLDGDREPDRLSEKSRDATTQNGGVTRGNAWISESEGSTKLCHLDLAKLLGARRTFQKPFSMTQLLDAVRYELDH